MANCQFICEKSIICLHIARADWICFCCLCARVRTRLLIIFKCQSGPKNQRIYFDQKYVYILYIQATPLKNKETLMGIRRISRFVFIKEKEKKRFSFLLQYSPACKLLYNICMYVRKGSPFCVCVRSILIIVSKLNIMLVYFSAFNLRIYDPIIFQRSGLFRI